MALILVMVAVVIASQAAARFLARSTFPSGLRSFAGPTVENALGYLPVYLGSWVWLRASSKRPFQSLGFESRGAPRKALDGSLIAGLMIAPTAGLAIIPGASLAPGKWRTSGLAVLGIGFLSLLGSAVQGPAEEVLFRGWLLPVVGARIVQAWTRAKSLCRLA